MIYQNKQEIAEDISLSTKHTLFIMGDHCPVELKLQECDFQQYCNYPETSKPGPRVFVKNEEQYCNDTSCSSGLPSCTSAVSDTSTPRKETHTRDQSPSLGNFLKLSISSKEQSGNTSEDSQIYEVLSTDEEQIDLEVSHSNVLNCLHPEGWIKYASDPDPWNTKFYTETKNKKLGFGDGILTREDVSECTNHLTQLPDTKAYVYSRLHINKMDLEDISVLSNYQYLMCIDMSWNLISDLSGLSNCRYLIYLNVSHNKISKVLDFKAPWFLTHANLSCNEIKKMGTGNLSGCWSLKYLDLSYNLIEKIEGLEELRYLTYLNLSHNFIKQVENLHCPSLLELDLSFNKITGFAEGDSCFLNSKDLRELNLAHNFLTGFHNFEYMQKLTKLDVSYNNFIAFSRICSIVGLQNLKELKFNDNKICSARGYRESLVFKLPGLEKLDSLSVNLQERVAARMLWEPDIYTTQIHLRTKIKLWNEIATQTIDPGTVPYDESLVPLIVLVGTFKSNKTEIAKRLASEFPDKVYRFTQITTEPTCKNDKKDSFSVDKLREIEGGKYLCCYKEAGYEYTVGTDQLSKCILEGKLGIIDTNLDGALLLQASGCRPFLVLCIYEDTDAYESKLHRFFTESQREDDSFSSCSGETQNSVALDETIEKKSTFKTHSFNENRSIPQNTSERSLSYEMVPGSRSRIEVNQCPTFMPQCTEKSRLTPEQSGDDDFVWEWTYEPSVVYEPEPSESYQNLLRSRDTIIRNALQQQSLYVEMHNAHPSLFSATVFTSDLEDAVKKVGKICCEIYNKRGKLSRPETVLDRPESKKFVEARVQSLMKGLINVPTGI